MGKRLRSQRRGRGTPRYLATNNSFADISYLPYDDQQRGSVLRGQVADLYTDCGHFGVLADVIFENSKRETIVAAEGMAIGQQVLYGKTADVAIGNVLPLGRLPEGCPIFNIEMRPGDGGKLVRSSGLYALVMAKDAKGVWIKLPSRKMVALKPDCRATIGCVSGGGRPEKPMLKAGANYWLHKSRRKHYPGLRGVAMNPVDHPFGGSQHHPGKSKSTSRNAPPGRKVGAIASSRTGRRKKG